jgi:NodT family efflux transporter outer membrane factor (OMF) lipoprotein
MPVVAILLSSCGIPQLRPPFAGRDVPPTFNGVTSEDNSSQVPIDEFFNDPVLTDLIDQGLTGSLPLKILNEDIQIANNEVWGRTGAYLPMVTIGGGAGLAKPSFFTPAGAVEDQLLTANGQHFPNPLPSFLAASDLSWQIDIWRQLRNARDAAALRYLGTADGRNYVITRLVAEIAENYFELMALDKRMENLDRIIALQEQSLEVSKLNKEGVRGTELAVQRFLAEVRKNQSEKLIVTQEIIEAENRINFLVGRYPEAVERLSDRFFTMNLHPLSLGVPAALLQNRPDIRQAERELAAAGLDIKVAQARFYPTLMITAGVGWTAFNPRYWFQTPESLIYNVAGNLVAPLINKRAIQADYMNANARQLQALYNYQKVILNAFTEVINRISKVQNYSNSVAIKQQQVEALEESVDIVSKLYNFARAEYIDLLFAQRDLRDARMVLIDTRKEQLTAIVETYQALGGGLVWNQFSEAGTAQPQPVMPAPGAPTEPIPAPPPVPEDGDENPFGRRGGVKGEGPFRTVGSPNRPGRAVLQAGDDDRTTERALLPPHVRGVGELVE